MSNRSNLTSRPFTAGRCTRRTFLLSGLMALIAAVPGYGARALAQPRLEACVQPQWLRRIVAGQAAAARLGRAYLDKHPQQRDCARLMTSIESTLQEQGASFSAGANGEQTAAVLQQLVRGEYARGEVTSVAGWEVSVTEARLYALVSMTD